MKVKSFTRCACGAITVITDDGKDYSCFQENLERFFPNTDFRSPLIKEYNETYSCNHCVNGWGLDLCACGSKENVGECECGGKLPYQTIS